MALFLAHGKLVFAFNLGEQRVKVKSLEKYNDGAWHDVSLHLQLRVIPSSAFPTTDDPLLSCSRLSSSVTAAAPWAAWSSTGSLRWRTEFNEQATSPGTSEAPPTWAECHLDAHRRTSR